MKICEGRISSRFGMRNDPISRSWTEHNGVDIATPIGTKVFAPQDGEITAIYDNVLGGKTLIMHSAEYRFGFCHLSHYEKRVGDTVRKGDLIARSGNTGRSTGAHLHFTVSAKGKYIDPEPFLEL